MFALCSKITIGDKSFTGVNEVKIKRSVHEMGATATIKVPVTAVLRPQGEPATQVETAQAVKVGDKVEIELGYDGLYNLEFRGSVKLLNLKTPLEIICEDEFYTTRSRNVTLQGQASLGDILKACSLDVGQADTLSLAAFQADDKPVSWVLSKLQSDYGLQIWFDLDGKVYATQPCKVVGEEVKYRLRYNVISDDDLKFRRADDVKIGIKAVCVQKDGSQIEAQAGDGPQKKLYFYDVAGQDELQALAEAELRRYSYDGYAGKITTFLQPFAAPAMAAAIEDEVYSVRNGRYYIESVETTYGTSGARRTVEIGLKL